MKVLIFQLDGKLPNIALMRIAAHHRALGDSIEFRWTGNPERQLWDAPDRVYASAIFKKTHPALAVLNRDFPAAIVGGTGVDVASTLEAVGITTLEQDYSIYPDFHASIGFSQRGCRLKCSFCVVPRKEGKMRGEQTIHAIWRGVPWPRDILLLDNDFFGQPDWRDRVAEIRDGKFRVCFSQGINARLLNAESAAALSGVDYRDDSFTAKRLYTAWDNRKDEAILFRGLEWLTAAGVRPDHIMVYMLIGYWPGETEEDRLYRHAKLRAFGCRPYPMPFTRSPDLVGFQRWVIGAYDKRIPWGDWKAANYRPENLRGCAA
jgi:hypothetical protein